MDGDSLTETQQQVIDAEERWVEIYLQNDADSFSQLLAEDFVYTSPVCEVVDRQTYLDNLRNRVVVMDYVTPSEREVRVHGDAAVVTAQWMVKESYRGQAFEGPCRIMRVWVRDGGAWRALAFQVTECSRS